MTARCFTFRDQGPFREGDKLRVTVEGVLRPGGNPHNPWFALDVDSARREGALIRADGAGVVSVEKLEAPLAVGDDIWPKNRTGVATRRVLATFEREGELWVVFNPFHDDGPPLCRPAANYERAPL